MHVHSSDPDPPDATSRWELIRDLLIFQLKLALDALRDIVLVPVSLVAGIVDLAWGGDPPGKNFYEAVRFGRRTERWINLFGAVETDEEADETEALPSLDSLVGQVERLIVDQAEQGGMTASARDAIDRSLDRISDARGKGGRREASSAEIAERRDDGS